MLNAEIEPPQRTIPGETRLLHARRIRRSPYTPLVERHGVTGWTVYNHMLLPVAIEGVAEDYEHLRRAVQVWDVAAERQVEIAGPDATELMQLMTPRRMTDAPTMRCLYAPICDADGGMLNDPLVLRLESDRWWISVADSDVLLYAKGIAAGRGLHVAVREPDVFPLAVQGPRADDLAARVFGEAVRDLRFFGAGRFDALGARHVVTRSGWSGQGGFEVFVEGWERTAPMWEALMEAGRDLDVRPGCPNAIERIESGLLSFGNDMTLRDDPYQCGLGRYVDPDAPCLAREALRARAEPTRGLRGLRLEGGAMPVLAARWPLESEDGEPVGHVTSAALSPRLGAIGIGMLDRRAWEPGTRVRASLPDGTTRAGRVATLPLKDADA